MKQKGDRKTKKNFTRPYYYIKTHAIKAVAEVKPDWAFKTRKKQSCDQLLAFKLGMS